MNDELTNQEEEIKTETTIENLTTEWDNIEIYPEMFYTITKVYEVQP